MAQEVERKVNDLIPGYSSLYVEVSSGKLLKPELPVMHLLECKMLGKKCLGIENNAGVKG